MTSKDLQAHYRAELAGMLGPEGDRHVNPKTTAWMLKHTALTELDTQGPRENRRDEADRRRTRPLPGVDREQPRTGTDREGNARPLFARACPHNRPGGPMNPRVSGSSAAVTATTATAILQTLRPAH